jgi:hypothetical protein
MLYKGAPDKVTHGSKQSFQAMALRQLDILMQKDANFYVGV